MMNFFDQSVKDSSFVGLEVQLHFVNNADRFVQGNAQTLGVASGSSDNDTLQAGINAVADSSTK